MTTPTPAPAPRSWTAASRPRCSRGSVRARIDRPPPPPLSSAHHRVALRSRPTPHLRISPDLAEALCASLPVAPKDKPSPIDRSYYHDVEGWLTSAIAAAAAAAPIAAAARSADLAAGPAAGGVETAATCVLPRMRVLRYTRAGGALPPHTDLPRVGAGGRRSTHTFLLYVGDCGEGGAARPVDSGRTLIARRSRPARAFLCLSHSAPTKRKRPARHAGETLLLEALPGDERLARAGGLAPGARTTLARVPPRRGRLLLMPHACPHAAAPTAGSAPKVVIRGELWFVGDRAASQ